MNVNLVLSMTSPKCHDLRESDPCRGHGRSSGQWMAVAEVSLVFCSATKICSASRRRTAGVPALASSKKESVSGSLAAWQDEGRNMVKLHCNRFK